MNSKIKIILATLLFFAFILTAAYFLGFRTELILFMGFLVIVMEIALLDPPRKHKQFSNKDIRKAVNLHFGRNIGVTDSGEIGSKSLNKRIRNWFKKYK